MSSDDDIPTSKSKKRRRVKFDDSDSEPEKSNSDVESGDEGETSNAYTTTATASCQQPVKNLKDTLTACNDLYLKFARGQWGLCTCNSTAVTANCSHFRLMTAVHEAVNDLNKHLPLRDPCDHRSHYIRQGSKSRKTSPGEFNVRYDDPGVEEFGPILWCAKNANFTKMYFTHGAMGMPLVSAQYQMRDEDGTGKALNFVDAEDSSELTAHLTHLNMPLEKECAEVVYLCLPAPSCVEGSNLAGDAADKTFLQTNLSKTSGTLSQSFVDMVTKVTGITDASSIAAFLTSSQGQNLNKFFRSKCTRLRVFFALMRNYKDDQSHILKDLGATLAGMSAPSQEDDEKQAETELRGKVAAARKQLVLFEENVWLQLVGHPQNAQAPVRPLFFSKASLDHSGPRAIVRILDGLYSLPKSDARSAFLKNVLGNENIDGMIRDVQWWEAFAGVQTPKGKEEGDEKDVLTGTLQKLKNVQRTIFWCAALGYWLTSTMKRTKTPERSSKRQRRKKIKTNNAEVAVGNGGSTGGGANIEKQALIEAATETATEKKTLEETIELLQAQLASVNSQKDEESPKHPAAQTIPNPSASTSRMMGRAFAKNIQEEGRYEFPHEIHEKDVLAMSLKESNEGMIDYQLQFRSAWKELSSSCLDKDVRSMQSEFNIHTGVVGDVVIAIDDDLFREEELTQEGLMQHVKMDPWTVAFQESEDSFRLLRSKWQTLRFNNSLAKASLDDDTKQLALHVNVTIAKGEELFCRSSKKFNFGALFVKGETVTTFAQTVTKFAQTTIPGLMFNHFNAREDSESNDAITFATDEWLSNLKKCSCDRTKEWLARPETFCFDCGPPFPLYVSPSKVEMADLALQQLAR